MIWATIFGLAAYTFDWALMQLTGPLAVALSLVGIGGLVLTIVYIRRHVAQLQAKADRSAGTAPPDPEQPPL